MRREVPWGSIGGRPWRITFAIVCVGMLTTGCSGIGYHDATNSKTVQGIRYHRPATYILVLPDYDKGAAKVTLWHGPDTSRVYAADPYAWFATNKTSLEFSDGMLSKVSSEADSTKLPQTMITAATEVTKATLEQLAKAAQVSSAIARAGAAALLKTEAGATDPPIFLFIATERGILQIYPVPGP